MPVNLNSDLPTAVSLSTCTAGRRQPPRGSARIPRTWRWTINEDYPGILLAILPPGAFLGLGMLIALKNIIDKRLSGRSTEPLPAAEPVTNN